MRYALSQRNAQMNQKLIEKIVKYAKTSRNSVVLCENIRRFDKMTMFSQFCSRFDIAFLRDLW